MNLKETLEKRGFLHQFTNEKAFEEFSKGGKRFYFGVDCSNSSLTIGNFVALQMAIYFMLAGNKCFLLVGGATSTIGNPSGKDKERPILLEEDLKRNQDGIHKQFGILVKNVEKVTGKKLEYEVVNNYDFFKDMNVLDFLKEVGRFMTVNRMMSKDIVRKRIEDPDKFISYAEFSYMLIMGYDYYFLNKNFGVTLEVGGSDEWDGILSGIELVQKKLGKEVYGFTNKLLLDGNGKKFGKSEGNAIWLDKDKSSPYFMYQYFINTLDNDIERYLKLLTYLTDEEIEDVVKKHFENPEQRRGQKILAFKVIELIHGEKFAKVSEKVSELLFGNVDKIELLKGLTNEELEMFFSEIGGCKYEEENLFEIIVKSGLANSNSEVRNAISSGAIYINEQKITDLKYDFSRDFIDDKILLIRKGKKSFKLVLR